MDQQNAQPDAEETLDYVTPYALSLHPTLFGKAIARPIKRLSALCIDGVVIALLAKIPFIVAIAIFLFAFVKRHSKHAPGSSFFPENIRTRVVTVVKALFGLTAIMVAILFAVGIVFYFSDESEYKKYIWKDDIVVNDFKIKQEEIKKDAWALRLLLIAKNQEIEAEECGNKECWQQLLLDLAGFLPEFLEEETGKAVIQSYVEASGLSMQQQNELIAVLYQQYGSISPAERQAIITPYEEQAQKQQDRTKPHSIVAWVQGILGDLGIGFGWAAMYFTVFTSSFNGRTLGKYLMGLRVVKLDNSKITFWDAFGRYGGYAAGISTGLLGFLQVYWDPNRQTIQDKIATTIVIDLKKPDWQSHTSE